MTSKTAAQRDKANERFAVYPGTDQPPFFTNDRAEAVKLAHQTNGNWCRVPRDFQASDLDAA